jgi:hypothetical protein
LGLLKQTSFIIHYLGQARLGSFVRNGDYFLKRIAVAKCTQRHS